MMPDLVASGDTLSLETSPEAQVLSIETLIGLAIGGRVRVPGFQRGLKWKAQDVVDLFASVRSGLPIGSLLMWKRRAESGQVALGPLTISAPSAEDALWVVDGQQRLVALTVSLRRPVPIPRRPDDPYVVYFDPQNRKFCAPPVTGYVPDQWVELPYLVDATKLSEFVFEWQFGRDATLRSALFEAGRRIREYKVPLYVVETENEQVLREIFFLVNKTGQALRWHDVHDALFGSYGGQPSTIPELSLKLESIGMGRLSDGELSQCLLALRGLDVTRTLAEHYRRDPDCLKGAVGDAVPVLQRVFSFLRDEAEVPHLRLLPVSFIVEPLARFFALHPNARRRSLVLLTRWVWRTIFSEETHNDRTFRRKSIRAIDADEESSVQRLVALVAKASRSNLKATDPFDARSTRTRTVVLLLSLMGPRDLETSDVIDIAELLNAEESAAFPRLLPSAGAFGRTPVNRLIHRPLKHLRQHLIGRVRDNGSNDPVIGSHGISSRGALALLADDAGAFFEDRLACLEVKFEEAVERLAGWGRGDMDRPSIDYILRSSDEIETNT